MKPKLTIGNERVSVKRFCKHFDMTPEQIERAVTQYCRARQWRLESEAKFKLAHGVTKSAARLRIKRKAEQANRKAAEARQARDLATSQLH